MKCEGKWFVRFREFQAVLETKSEHEIKAFWWMSSGESISKDFEAFSWNTALKARLNTLD